MKTRVLKTLTICTAAIFLSTGCEAVRSWDAMKIQEKQKHAVYALSEKCDNGDTNACAFLAGQGIRIEYPH